MSKTGLVLFQVVSRHEYPVKPSSADINENILSEQCREEYQLTEENVKSAKSLDQVEFTSVAQKNRDNTVIFDKIFITGTNQVRAITDNIVPLQSGSVFYKRAKLTGPKYKHRYIFTLDGNHRVIFTLDDHITIPPFTGRAFLGVR